MKIHLHKQYTQPALLFGVCSAALIFMMVEEGFSLPYFTGLSFTLLFTFVALARTWKYRGMNKVEFEKQWENPRTITFSEQTIYFPDGYYFSQSSISKSKKINREQINEINMSTAPPSVIINNNEVIFIGYDFRDKLQEYAVRNNIPIVNRADIWSHINEPFLDTEFTEEEKQRTIRLLTENGVSPEETEAIRHKIHLLMVTNNYFAMDWIKLSQFDYLNWGSGSKKNYWWSMDIALRNFNLGKTQL